MSEAEQPHQKFRSLLPHEPLPKEDAGYIHLQGAFEPKNKKTKDSEEDSAKESPSSPPCFHWTSHTSLVEALFDVLSNQYQSLRLPYPVQSVHVVDPNLSPPFTKARLTYESPLQALEVQQAWRAQRVTPAQMFSSIISSSSIHNDNDMNVVFGTHACQCTMITATPVLLLPSTTSASSSSSWTRSSPPKFRRLLHANTDSEERSRTRFVFVTELLSDDPQSSNATFWKHPHAVVGAIRNVWNQYDSTGAGVEVFLSNKKNQAHLAKSCHIGMRSAEDCQRVIKELQGQRVTWEYNGETVVSGALFLDYASVTQRSLAKSKSHAAGEDFMKKGEVSRPDCTSSTDSVHVPGLIVVENFLTVAQEAVLMATLTGPQAPWAPDQTNKSETGAVKRLVQHYGYVFDYQTADVLRDRTRSGANCPHLPAAAVGKDDAANGNGTATLEDNAESGRGWETFAGVIDHTRSYEFEMTDRGQDAKEKVSYPHINQVTINHYRPGEGIGSHVDTPSAFGDGLISISLNGGIVMEFRKVGDNSIKKLVYLPPRSLVLMAGPARYEWEHMIVTRKTDTVNGAVLTRKLRVSLTLRTALTEDGSPLPSVESSDFPPTWGEQQKSSGSLITPATERDHVHAVYDAIATQWHHTRGKRGVLWPGATQFLQRLPIGSVVADCGCGDGKYFPAVWEAGSYVIGTDISLPLLQTAFSKSETTPDTRKVSPHREALRDRPSVAVGDCMSVPIRSKSCDAAICIAVMHHLSTEERRIRCIEELVRIVRVGGMINIQAWALEQEQNSRRRFAASDVFVPFNAQPKYLEKVDATGSNKPPGNVHVDESKSKSVAEMYSEAYTKADFDEKKGLVVFKRYCHLYRTGEMEEILQKVAGARLVQSGYESGNHFVILEVTD